MGFRFKPADFDRVCDYEDMAQRANGLLDAHLATLPVVYGVLNPNLIQFSDSYKMSWNGELSTHQALLFDVKPIEKKECEHKDIKTYDVHPVAAFCNNCGIQMKQKQLWEPA